MAILNLFDVHKTLTVSSSGNVRDFVGSVSMYDDKSNDGLIIEWKNEIGWPLKMKFNADQLDSIINFMRKHERV